MKKRLLALALTLCMAASLLALPAAAADSGVVETVRAMGILVGDTGGNLNLEGNVTRAQFAKMMVAASDYRDSVGEDATGYSLFKDVKSSYWASAYIRIAVEQGWIVGYTDGTFRPAQTITLEQACTAALRMLGYDASGMAGTYPYAQLAKASSLGLRDQITLQRGGVMTRMDCAQLLYNLMTAQTSDGKTYASTVGYTVTNGQVDYASIVSGSLSGPFVADSGSLSLPFASSAATVYVDGTRSSLSAATQYDVYYYSANLSTVWIYTSRAAGTVTAVSPSTAAPSSVTVGGTTYSIGTASAAYKLSALGGFSVGSTAVLLLGMDGSVADVISGADADTVYYGVVTGCQKSAAVTGSASVQTSVTVACTDGAEHTFTLEGARSYSTGALVTASVTGSGTSVTNLSRSSVSGKVNSAATALGSLSFADNVQILDVGDDGAWARIYPGRLAGCTLSESAISFCKLNSAGEIERLILNDATGDTWQYGYMISASSTGSYPSISSSYRYVLNGTSHTENLSGTRYSVSGGGIAVRLDNNAIDTVKNISSVSVSGLSALSATGGSKTYALADDVQVYIRRDSSYYLTPLSSVNPSDYTLTGWYDSFGCPAGGLIRVIVAEARSSES